MEVFLLGPLFIKVDGNRHTVPGKKLGSLIAVLAMAGGDLIHRDELVEELGFEQSMQRNVNALHAHVTRLRRWLDKACVPSEILISEANGYRLDIDARNVDALRFIELIEAAWKLGRAEPREQVAVLEEALGLWRGTAFANIADGARVVQAANSMQQLKLEAQELMVGSLAQLADYKRVIVTSSRFISEDPLREGLWDHLMSALYDEGRYAEVLSNYQRVSQLLAEELGIDPNPKLRAHFDRVVGVQVPAR